jgi:hypothetical protein
MRTHSENRKIEKSESFATGDMAAACAFGGDCATPLFSNVGSMLHLDLRHDIAGDKVSDQLAKNFVRHGHVSTRAKSIGWIVWGGANGRQKCLQVRHSSATFGLNLSSAGAIRL